MKVVTHLISGLGKGGAETMLYQLLKNKKSQTITHKVVSMGGSSYYEKLIKDLNIELITLNFKKRPLISFYKLIKYLKITKTDLINTWMYHANFIGYFAAKFSRVKSINWNIRHSNLQKEYNKKTTLIINKFCSKISHKVDIIAYNGYLSRKIHERAGYSDKNSIVILNGIDTNDFKFDTGARKKILTELCIPQKKKIILSVARYHPIKDIPTFIKVLSHSRIYDDNIVGIMCGEGIDTNNSHIVEMCRQNNLTINQDVYLLGFRTDVNKLMSSCDVFVLHSASEAFPNTLLQAMACESLCVTTNVGDAKKIIANEKLVVEPHDYLALSNKILEILHLPEDLKFIEKKKNVNKIIENYDIHHVLKEYELLLIDELNVR